MTAPYMDEHNRRRRLAQARLAHEVSTGMPVDASACDPNQLLNRQDAADNLMRHIMRTVALTHRRREQAVRTARQEQVAIIDAQLTALEEVAVHLHNMPADVHPTMRQLESFVRGRARVDSLPSLRAAYDEIRSVFATAV